MANHDTGIEDRIYGAYFRKVGGPAPDAPLPTITDVKIQNELDIPLKIYFIAPSAKISNNLTPFDPNAVGRIEEGDFYHRDGVEQLLYGATKNGDIPANAAVSVDKAIFSDFSLMPFIQIKVMALATKAVLGFWSYRSTDVQGKLLQVTLGRQLMREPNDICDPPAPTPNSPIPRDSPKIVVGFGKLPVAKNYVIHHQYWRKAAGSYCLPPGGRKTVIFATTAGMTTMSASVDSIGASMSASAGGGYGAISAGLSMALNTNATTEGSQTVEEERSVEVMDEIVNPYVNIPVSILAWELVDSYAVCKDATLLQSFEVTQAPTVLRYFPPNATPCAPSDPHAHAIGG